MLMPNHGDEIILIPIKLTNMKICLQIGYKNLDFPIHMASTVVCDRHSEVL